jgi:hypothetical protein
MASTIQIRRGLEAARGAVTFADGEIFYITDTDQVWIGDGATAGGIDFVGNHDIPATNLDGTENEIITFDSSGDAVSVGGSANNVLTLNGSGVPTFAGITSSNVNAGDFITDLSTAPGANKFVDAATVRAYILSQVNGLSWRDPVDMLDTVNAAKPATTATTVDGETVADGDRVLFTNLSGGELADNNSVFLASVDSAGDITWTQEQDGQDSSGEPTDGDVLFVRTGTNFADQTYAYNGTSWVLAASLNGALLASNNLSDVANAATSLSNIGGIGAATTDTLENKTIVSQGAGGNNPITIDYTDLSDETAGDILYWDGSAGPQTLPIGTEGQLLTVTSGIPSWVTASGAGLGDVSGPGSSTDNGIARFDGTTGKIIQNGSGVTLSDTGSIDGATIDGGSF